MATLPKIQGRDVPGNSRPIASISPSAAAAPGNALAQLGNTVNQVGEVVQDREDTAAAKERDAYVSDEIRKLMYDPESGFANLSGKDAVAEHEKALKKLEDIQELALKDLSGGARRKLESTLKSRLDAAKQRIDIHTSGERRTWLKGASEARIVSARQDALAQDGDFAQAYGVVATEIRQQADLDGWSDEELDLKLSNARSEMLVEHTKKYALEDPEFALEFLEKNEAGFQPADMLELRAKIEPKAKQQRGERLGDAAFDGAKHHNTQIDFELAGKQRPNPPAKKLQSVLGVAAERTLGKGARIVIYSGQENDGHQHGSNRHKTGLAADIRVYDPDGKLLSLSDPRAKEFMLMAAQLGARGIGAGAEYMGDAFHIDMVPHADYQAGQGPVWGSASKAIGNELIEAMNSPTSGVADLSTILAEPDADVRRAALQRFNARQAEDDATNEFASAELGVKVSSGIADQADVDAALREGTISPSRWETLSEQLISVKRAEEKKLEAVNDFTALLNAGSQPNPYNDDHRKAVNQLDEMLVDRVGDENADILNQQRLSLLQTTKIAPEGLVDELRLGMSQRSVEAFETADQAIQIAPQAFAAIEGGGDISKSVSHFRAYTAVGMSAEEAARRATPTTEEKAANAAIETDVAKELREFDHTVLENAFTKWIGRDPAVGQFTQTRAKSDFSTLYRVARQDGLPAEAAEAWAVQHLTDPQTGIYGVSEFASGEFVKGTEAGVAAEVIASGLSFGKVHPGGADSKAGVMRLPPERFYPQIDGGHDYLKRDLAESLNSLEDWDGGEWHLVADEAETVPFARLAQSGTQVLPGYKLIYQDKNGAVQFKYWRMEEGEVAELMQESSAENQVKYDETRKALETLREQEPAGIQIQPKGTTIPGDTIFEALKGDQ